MNNSLNLLECGSHISWFKVATICLNYKQRHNYRYFNLEQLYCTEEWMWERMECPESHRQARVAFSLPLQICSLKGVDRGWSFVVSTDISQISIYDSKTWKIHESFTSLVYLTHRWIIMCLIYLRLQRR